MAHYQRTATTITSAWKRNPAKAERGGGTRPSRILHRQPCPIIQSTDATEPAASPRTGHIAYEGGDNVAIVKAFPERIHYVHLKQVDPEVRERVRRENLPLSEAVKLGAMVEPPNGEPDMPPLLDALAELGTDLFCVIEQDLYPVEPDVPLPIAARTAGYFVACGLGPVRRWPYNR